MCAGNRTGTPLFASKDVLDAAVVEIVAKIASATKTTP
jgi:hypothetical protein